MWLIIATEFINLISSESNEICSKEEKRTIAPEHVLRALEVRMKYIMFCALGVGYALAFPHITRGCSFQK